MVRELDHWRSGKTPAPDGVVLLNWLLENGLLDGGARGTRAGTLPGLLERYRRMEAALPAPRRAPALADGTGEDDHVLLRGNYRTPGPRVPRRPPQVLGPDRPTAAAGSGQMDLAQRLTDPSNPLLARVMVNRIWQHHFGEGLVRTPDDFGRMGQAPTHPELLDWLAGEFVRRGWSVKAMHRLMLRSSTYRQAAGRRSDQRDPENRLWHRRPVRRLEAEAIRDAVLVMSGRLDRTMYGPSVLPYLTPHCASSI
jgi:hypothetical protein